MRKFLIAAPAFALGCLLTASLTTVARAQDKTTKPKIHDYKVVTDAASLKEAGLKGYEIVSATTSGSGFVYWTLERK